LRALLVLLLLTGCQYRAGQGGFSGNYSTITIPYAGGDEDGRLTSSLVKKMEESHILSYCHTNGELVLVVNLLKVKDKNIGFRYDRKKDGERAKTIIPTETRRFLQAEVVVTEACSGREVLGPVRMTAYVDFDHDYYTVRDQVNIFSLGQLVDIDAAYDAAWEPLYDKLAEKVIDWVNNA
jgi:hypothetical protein